MVQIQTVTLRFKTWPESHAAYDVLHGVGLQPEICGQGGCSVLVRMPLGGDLERLAEALPLIPAAEYVS